MRQWRSGSAIPCQGIGRGFDPRLPLEDEPDDVGYRRNASLHVASMPRTGVLHMLVFPPGWRNADALGLGPSGRKVVRVRVPLWAPIIPLTAEMKLQP